MTQATNSERERGIENENKKKKIKIKIKKKEEEDDLAVAGRGARVQALALFSVGLELPQLRAHHLEGLVAQNLGRHRLRRPRGLAWSTHRKSHISHAGRAKKILIEKQTKGGRDAHCLSQL